MLGFASFTILVCAYSSLRTTHFHSTDVLPARARRRASGGARRDGSGAREAIRTLSVDEENCLSSSSRHSAWSHARYSLPLACARHQSMRRSPAAAGNTAGSVDEQCLLCVADVMIVPSGVELPLSISQASCRVSERRCADGCGIRWARARRRVGCSHGRCEVCHVAASRCWYCTRDHHTEGKVRAQISRVHDGVQDAAHSRSAAAVGGRHRGRFGCRAGGNADTMLRDKVAQQMKLSRVRNCRTRSESD